VKKNFLPISIDISRQKILVIGGGQSAFNKIKILQRFDAEIEVLATQVCAEIKEMGIKYSEQAYRKELLEEYVLLYSCTNDPTTDHQILADGKEKGILVNIHDQPALCQFVSPAILKYDNISIAVSSNGENVFESIRVRNRIKDFLSEKHN